MLLGCMLLGCNGHLNLLGCMLLGCMLLGCMLLGLLLGCMLLGLLLGCMLLGLLRWFVTASGGDLRFRVVLGDFNRYARCTFIFSLFFLKLSFLCPFIFSFSRLGCPYQRERGT